MAEKRKKQDRLSFTIDDECENDAKTATTPTEAAERGDEECTVTSKRPAISFDAFRFVPDVVPDAQAAAVPATLPAATSNNSKSAAEGTRHGGPGEVRLLEKYSTPGHPERPLRLLFVGHNPSDHAWASKHYYSNPVNRFWPLLRSTAIIPATFTAEDDDRCPELLGIGFTDVGHGNPGTHSNAFTSSDFARWRGKFFTRLRGHIRRAAETAGCSVEDAAPRIIAFTGKRQWQELFFDKKKMIKSMEYGVQSVRPIGWPAEASRSIVFLLTSPSGAAALTNEDREAPYRQLSALLQAYPWPDPRPSAVLLPETQPCTEQPAESEAGGDDPSATVR